MSLPRGPLQQWMAGPRMPALPPPQPCSGSQDQPSPSKKQMVGAGHGPWGGGGRGEGQEAHGQLEHPPTRPACRPPPDPTPLACARAERRGGQERPPGTSAGPAHTPACPPFPCASPAGPALSLQSPGWPLLDLWPEMRENSGRRGVFSSHAASGLKRLSGQHRPVSWTSDGCPHCKVRPATLALRRSCLSCPRGIARAGGHAGWPSPAVAVVTRGRPAVHAPVASRSRECALLRPLR